MREAPSVVIVEALLGAGAQVAVHDPAALERAREVFGTRVSYHRGNYEALRGAHGLLVVTEWNEFRRPDWARMRELMREPVIFDGRNLYEPEVLRAEGFTYYPIGRAAVYAPVAARPQERASTDLDESAPRVPNVGFGKT